METAPKTQSDMAAQIFDKLYVDKSVRRGNGRYYAQILIIYKLIVLMKRNIGVLELTSIYVPTQGTDLIFPFI